MMLLGVDPGGRETGIVLRDGRALHRWMLITREGDLDVYCKEVAEAVGELVAWSSDPPTIVVEDLNEPSGHMGIVGTKGLLDTAQVLGGLATLFDIVRVPPGGHGSGPLKAYPAPLVGDREIKGAGRLRHCRSAWDIAGYGLYSGRIKVVK